MPRPFARGLNGPLRSWRHQPRQQRHGVDGRGVGHGERGRLLFWRCRVQADGGGAHTVAPHPPTVNGCHVRRGRGEGDERCDIPAIRHGRHSRALEQPAARRSAARVLPPHRYDAVERVVAQPHLDARRRPHAKRKLGVQRLPLHPHLHATGAAALRQPQRQQAVGPRAQHRLCRNLRLRRHSGLLLRRDGPQHAAARGAVGGHPRQPLAPAGIVAHRQGAHGVVCGFAGEPGCVWKHARGSSVIQRCVGKHPRHRRRTQRHRPLVRRPLRPQHWPALPVHDVTAAVGPQLEGEREEPQAGGRVHSRSRTQPHGEDGHGGASGGEQLGGRACGSACQAGRGE
mmetsp:Transcript_25123/g.81262  ORF Transcript_25123/g.81262 Transcript_25123/m.81262 type:complete len:342 (+) Transcript_25123:3309-4334(+)